MDSIAANIPRVLLIDDYYGDPAQAEEVGSLLGASSVTDAITGQSLWSRSLAGPANGARGLKSLDALDVRVSTGQVWSGAARTNSQEVVKQALSTGWPKAHGPGNWRWALVVLDLTFTSSPPVPEQDGQFGYEILRLMAAEDLCPGLSVAILSDRDDVPTERVAARAGGSRMVVLLPKSQKARVPNRLRELLVASGLLPDAAGDMVGLSLPWLYTLRAARVRAKARCSLLRGPKGSGKEGLSRYVHDWSSRKGSFEQFSVSSGASEPAIVGLFGSVAGKATGVGGHRGLFDIASGGTLFLDEIHNAAMDIQERLLDVFEHKADGKYYVTRVGSTAREEVDPFGIAATNLSDLELDARLATGALRADLYERLDGEHAIRIPPLQDRLNDVPILVHHFVHSFDERNDTPTATQVSREVDAETIDALCDYVAEAPAELRNVRWLRNVVDSAIRSYPQLRVLLPQHISVTPIGQRAAPPKPLDPSQQHQVGNEAVGGQSAEAAAVRISPRAAVSILEHVDLAGVPFTDLHGVLGRLDKAAASLSAKVYVHAMQNQAIVEGARKAIVQKLSGNPALDGTQVSDQLLIWGLSWSDHNLDVPDWVKDEIAQVFRARSGKAFPGWGTRRNQGRTRGRTSV